MVAPNLDIFIKSNILGWQKIQAEITAFEKHLNGEKIEYEPIINFEIGSNVFQRTLEKTAKLPQIGEKVPVIFENSNPENAVVQRFEFWRNIGFVLILAGAVLLLAFVKKMIKKTQISFEDDGENEQRVAILKRTGVRIWGEIVDIEVIDGNRAKAMIRAKTFGGIEKIHRSDTIDGLTHGALVAYLANPTPIVIFVNPDNIEDYFVNSEDVERAITEKVNFMEGKNV